VTHERRIFGILAHVTTATAAPQSAPHVSVNRPNPVSVGTIVWLASELMFFAGLFAMYFTLRSTVPDEWAAETPLLNIPFAVANTTVLILSSVTCQMGVWAAERFQPRRSGSLLNLKGWGMNEWMTLTYIMGAVFIGGQIFEYAELVHEGLTISSSPYGSVFFLTTGFHGLHVIGGLIAFLFLLGRSFSAKRFGHHEATTAIVVSYYWHFVDIVWVALFATIYLIK
jgi:cytochrome c oxidase subunit III